MDVRARYRLVGAFTLAAIALGFAFVYWLQAPGRLGQRAVYRIHFAGSAAGLLKGSAVLFNGIRVGEVTGLTLDAADPGGVSALIAVDRQTPVRADTNVGIDFQGLTGAPVVALSGGSASLPLLGADRREPPLLSANKNAGQNVTQTATEVLRHIDGLIADNAAPLHSAIENVNTFADALARNNGKVDGIFAGLERMTGGGVKVETHIVDLPAARSFPDLKTRPSVQLLVPEPTTLSAYDAESIVLRGSATQYPNLQGLRWPDTLSKVVQARVLQSFENAQYMLAIGRGIEGQNTDLQLLIDMRGFSVQTDPETKVETELSAKIVKPDGQIVAAKVFSSSVPIASLDQQSVTKGMRDAFERVASEIVVWACGSI